MNSANFACWALSEVRAVERIPAFLEAPSESCPFPVGPSLHLGQPQKVGHREPPRLCRRKLGSPGGFHLPVRAGIGV